jgi:Spy/CpxP family protein refolding chaperone
LKVWKVILATLVIFTAGIVTGALLIRTFHRAQEHARRQSIAEHDVQTHTPPPTNAAPREPGRLSLPFGRPPGRSMGKEFLERLDHELKLDADQKKRVEKILDESQKRTKDIWEKVAPEMREEMKRSREKMREVLSAEQNTRLDELMKHAPKPGEPKPPREGAPESVSNLPPVTPPPPEQVQNPAR